MVCDIVAMHMTYDPCINAQVCVRLYVYICIPIYDSVIYSFLSINTVDSTDSCVCLTSAMDTGHCPVCGAVTEAAGDKKLI